MLYPSKLHRHSMQMTVLSYSNLDLTCIKEWSSSFALSKGLASSAMWDAEEPNRRQKQCISRPPNKCIKMPIHFLSKSMVVV